jgi:hypothetical protein
MTHLFPGAHLQARPLDSEVVHQVNHIFFQHISPKHQASSPTLALIRAERKRSIYDARKHHESHAVEASGSMSC